MERTKWYHIKNTMKDAGWKCVMELHPNIPQDVTDSLVADFKNNYPAKYFEHKTYRNHNAYLCLFAREKRGPKFTVEHNVYREPIIKRLDEQTQKGIDKYGAVLPQNTAPMLERIEHAQQELTDALVYNEWIAEGMITLAKHAVILQKHLTALQGLPVDDYVAIRGGQRKAIEMVNALVKEIGNIGKS